MFFQQEFPAEYEQQTNEWIKLEEMDCPMKYKFYFDYFKKHFNLVFERPRTDVYGVCKELKVKRSKEKKTGCQEANRWSTSAA